MKRCAFLTTASLDGFVIDDELAIGPLRDLGWETSLVSWRDTTVDWSRFHAVIIRTTWDYQASPVEFLDTLERISASSAFLGNTLHLVRWNLTKTYLRDLEQRGVEIVPTLWRTPGPSDVLDDWCDLLGTTRIVLKPVIGANAEHTYRYQRGSDSAHAERIIAALEGRQRLVQPFMSRIVEQGEFSLIFLRGDLSHAILKTPRAGDFRVQEEHGGVIRAVTADPALLEAGRRALQALPELPLYARVDLVASGRGSYALMELELIEPSLYLRMDRHAPARFARAIHRWASNEESRQGQL